MPRKRLFIATIVVLTLAVLAGGGWAGWRWYLVREVRRRARAYWDEGAVGSEDNVKWLTRRSGIVGIMEREALNSWREDPAYAAALLSMLCHRDEGLSQYAIPVALRICRDWRRLPPATTSGDGWGNLLDICLRLLCRSGAEDAGALIAGFSTDENSEIRWHIASTLRRFAVEEQVPLLLQLVRDPDESVAAWSLEGLREMKHPAVVSIAQEAFREADAHGDLRMSAALCLLELGPRKLHPELADYARSLAGALSDEGEISLGDYWLPRFLRAIPESDRKLPLWQKLFEDLRNHKSDRVRKMMKGNEWGTPTDEPE